MPADAACIQKLQKVKVMQKMELSLEDEFLLHDKNGTVLERRLG